MRKDFPYSFNFLNTFHETDHSRILCEMLNLHRY